MDDVQRKGKSFRETVSDTSGWQHFWTVYQAGGEPGSSDADRGHMAVSPHPDVSTDLQVECKRLQNLAKTLQASKDKAMAELKKEKDAKGGDRQTGARLTSNWSAGNDNANYKRQRYSKGYGR